MLCNSGWRVGVTTLAGKPQVPWWSLRVVAQLGSWRAPDPEAALKGLLQSLC